MAVPKLGRFSEFQLSTQEQVNGGLLTFDQRTLIANDRATVANMILNLQFDPLHPELFLQQDAHLKGQLAVYDFLFARNEESEAVMRVQIDSNKQS